MKVTNFKDLEVWKLGKAIVIKVYKVTADFPRNEMYGLVSQMPRVAVSLPSNVAEGFNRKHNRENRQFLYIALGSCAELETQVEIESDLKFIDLEGRDSLLEKLDHESLILRNLIKRL